jgi:large subunit ribosomal protein L18
MTRPHTAPRFKARNSKPPARARARADQGGRQRPSASVGHRSSKNIYAQIIDDAKGHTSPPPRRSRRISRAGSRGADKAAKAVGKLIAERAIKAGVKEVVFDRGGYIYHGRVKALADAAREGGLSF